MFPTNGSVSWYAVQCSQLSFLRACNAIVTNYCTDGVVLLTGRGGSVVVFGAFGAEARWFESQ